MCDGSSRWGDRTERLGVRFCLWELDMACASLGKGGNNGVAECSVVVLKPGISKQLWSAFCSFSPSKCGLIKYTMYEGKLRNCVPRQQEASGNHPSTHSVALGHVFLG